MDQSGGPNPVIRILKLLIHPDTLAGTECTAHMGSRVLREMGMKVYLAHDQAQAPKSAEGYDGSLGLPPLFDAHSKLPPRGLADAEKHLDEFIAENQIDVVHVHSYPRIGTFGRIVRKYCTVTGVHVPLCPNGRPLSLERATTLRSPYWGWMLHYRLLSQGMRTPG